MKQRSFSKRLFWKKNNEVLIFLSYSRGLFENSRAQALTEFIYFSSIIIIVIVFGKNIFITQWNKTFCAYLAFEKTHERLVGIKKAFSSPISIVETADSIKGEAKCGEIVEKIELIKLESRQ
jgi:hypothetical protein